MNCEHKWRTVHEEFLLGGHNPIGYECKICGKFVNQSDLTPSGKGVKEMKLTEDDYKKILHLKRTTTLSDTAIARRFHIGSGVISYAKTRLKNKKKFKRCGDGSGCEN